MSPEGINPELCGWSLRMVLLQGVYVFSGKFCFSSLVVKAVGLVYVPHMWGALY